MTLGNMREKRRTVARGVVLALPPSGSPERRSLPDHISVTSPWYTPWTPMGRRGDVTPLAHPSKLLRLRVHFRQSDCVMVRMKFDFTPGRRLRKAGRKSCRRTVVFKNVIPSEKSAERAPTEPWPT
jgi:hypothetical protein